MPVREFYVNEALHSFHSQRRILGRLTKEECLHALRLEAASRRRKSIIRRLIQRAVHVHERDYRDALKKEFLDAP